MDGARLNDCRIKWQVVFNNAHKCAVMHTWKRSNPAFPIKMMGRELIMITWVYKSVSVTRAYGG